MVLVTVSICLWGQSSNGLEHAGEMLRILEAQVICYLRDAFARSGKLLLGDEYNLVLYVFLNSATGLFLHQVTEITR